MFLFLKDFMDKSDIKKILITHLHRSNNRICSLGEYLSASISLIEKSEIENKEKLLHYLTNMQIQLKDIVDAQNSIWNDLTKD